MIGPDGAQLGLFQTFDALRKARDLGLDLVEISPTARPPVCKIMDYGKYKYELNKKQQEAKKKQIVVHIKEVKLRPATDQHDLETKIRHVKRFLEEGDKAKITIMYRGREMAHQELGHAMLKKVLADIGELAEVEQAPKQEGRNLFAILAPAKGKPKEKKGS